jgi:Tfp pilus assembly protein FimT
MCSGAKSFTLVEMLLVLMLVGMMIGVAIPRWRDVHSETSIRESSKMIIALADYAREKAVFEHKRYRLVFDMVESCYWLEKQKEFSKAGEETYEKVQDHLTKRFYLPDKFYFVEVKLGGKKVKNKYFIPFSPDGTSEDCEIIIAGESGEKWRIHILDRFGEATYNAQ